jgi:hypothetical protein
MVTTGAHSGAVTSVRRTSKTRLPGYPATTGDERVLAAPGDHAKMQGAHDRGNLQ